MERKLQNACACKIPRRYLRAKGCRNNRSLRALSKKTKNLPRQKNAVSSLYFTAHSGRVESVETLRDQQQLPCRSPRFQGLLRLRRFGQRKTLMDAQLQCAALDALKHVRGTRIQLFPCFHVVHQAGTRQEQRSAAR